MDQDAWIRGFAKFIFPASNRHIRHAARQVTGDSAFLLRWFSGLPKVGG